MNELTREELVALVKKMRLAQREFFKERKKVAPSKHGEMLQNCKNLEHDVDVAIGIIPKPPSNDQPGLL